MSVINAIQLPAQPVEGLMQQIPLGGDGRVSPQSVTQIRVDSTGDTSTGRNQVYIRLDTRYTQLVSYVRVQLGPMATSDQNVDIMVGGSAAIAMGVRRRVEKCEVSGINEQGVVSFSPHPLLMVADASADTTSAPLIRVTTDNENNQLMRVYASIFNFDRRARELTPIEYLNRVLVRSESAL